MPPQISDDEGSESGSVSSVAPERIVPAKKGRSKTSSVEKVEEPEEQLMVESEHRDEEDDEEIGEDEYVVEKITNHLVDEETGELRFEIKWEGFEKKSDRTWEPEENLLETASKILNEYLASVGGKEAILEAYHEKKAQAQSKKGKKRGRAATGAEEPAATNGAKRGRKGTNHPKDSIPPASAADFLPPSGSWEEEVVHIDACEGSDNAVVVYLTWKSGHKSQHPLAQVYKRCPQKMLKFYESHLVFKKNEDS